MGIKYKPPFTNRKHHIAASYKKTTQPMPQIEQDTRRREQINEDSRIRAVLLSLNAYYRSMWRKFDE